MKPIRSPQTHTHTELRAGKPGSRLSNWLAGLERRARRLGSVDGLVQSIKIQACTQFFNDLFLRGILDKFGEREDPGKSPYAFNYVEFD